MKTPYAGVSPAVLVRRSGRARRRRRSSAWRVFNWRHSNIINARGHSDDALLRQRTLIIGGAHPAELSVSERVPHTRFIIADKAEDFARCHRMMVHPDRFELHNAFVSDEQRTELLMQARVVVLPLRGGVAERRARA